MGFTFGLIGCGSDGDPASSLASPTLGKTSVFGSSTGTSLSELGDELLSQLDWKAGVQAVGKEIWRSETSSFHLFATNRTEPCHYHPGATFSQTLQGKGAFFVNYGPAVQQNAYDTFFIPAGAPHAFGPAPGVIEPVLVTVLWSPPFHDNYT